MGEAFPSLGPASAPVAKSTRRQDSASGGGGGFEIKIGRKGSKQSKGGMSSSQRKKAKKKNDRVAAGEWTKLEKV